MNLCRFPFIIFLCGMLLASCGIFTPKPRDMVRESMAPALFSKGTNGTAGPVRWWESFRSPELNRLVSGGLADNFSIREAWARLKQARALAIQKGSALMPDLSVSSDAGVTRRHPDNAPNINIEEYSLGLVSSYELDLWGRIRSEREAAVAEAGASGSDLESAAMTVAAEITDRWLQLVAEKSRYNMLQDQLKTNKTHLELIEMRFRNSLATALDVYQQKQAIARIESRIPLTEADIQVLLHEIAVLTGRPPRTELHAVQARFPELPPLPKTGLPTDLLESRPDIRAAALRLSGADWQVSAARADRLPALTLNASAGYNSGKFSLLFDNWFLRLAGSLTGPVFDGSRRAAEVERTRAVAEERLNAYKKTVLNAVREVEDALIREDRQARHLRALESELQISRNALREAENRYRQGLNDYLPVLTALQDTQSLEVDLITARSDMFRYRTALHRALGGTWTGGWEKEAIRIAPLNISPVPSAAN